MNMYKLFHTPKMVYFLFQAQATVLCASGIHGLANRCSRSRMAVDPRLIPFPIRLMA